MYSGQSVGDMNGFSISGNNAGWSTFKSISNPSPTSANSSREGSTRVFEDTVNWIKGSHALSMGGGVTRAKVWLYNQQLAPTITLGIATGDPADGMFTAANFPNASATDLTNARNLYAVLTGRITSIGRNARIGPDGTTFTILGPSNQYGRLNQWGTFIQDSWRVRQNLTINAGLRYDVQQPFYALNDSYSTATMDDIFGITGTGAGFVPGSLITGTGNLFKPGTLQGTKTTFKQFPKNTKAYNTDWGNIAPSAGAAWTTGANNGLLHTIFGAPGDSVVRGGYSRAFQRGGMSDFTGVYGSNPGISIDVSRSQTNGNLGTLPVLLTGSDLGAPATNLTRTFPMQVPNASSSVFAFDPNIKTPYADSFTVGWQRALARDMSVEARFIHTKSVGTWTLGATGGYLNYNELNIVDNKFVDEFRLAQGNLAANIAAGRGSTFAYTGVPGTSPLPILLAYLSGSNAVADPTKYTGAGWTNSSLVQSMFVLNPNPLTAANQIRTTASFLANGIAAGMPANFWVANPDVSQANVVANGPDTRYNGIQLVLNRRFAGGFLLQSSYSYGKAYEGAFYSFRKPYQETEQTFTHVWSANWLYELPFGRGRRLGADSGPVLDRIIGKWNFQGVARLQSGRLLDFGNVRLVGMTADDLRKAFQARKAQDPANAARTLVYMLPQDIIDNTIKAFSVTATGYSNGAPSGRYFAPANGPDCLETLASSATSATAGFGDCGVRSLIVTGPRVVRFDMSIVKQIPVAGSFMLETQLQVFNVFNNVNFNPVTGIGANPDNYQVTGAVDQSRTMQMAFRISW
ncbi:MAG: hypothetical protein DMF86_04450 [Acidobacteria bacterium]|nr:MAG: hypothetical protein DMF86_04450 [Acidobacteriota bacterium]